jgi:hypothetical protein
MDPKIPTPDNVNQLKSALMAALAKSKEKREEKPVVAKPLIPQAPIVKSVIPPAVPQASVKETPVKETPPAREVPEDVLKKVLKID